MSQIRIKVLAGPEAGTVVEGAGRVTIGSASYCNLRLSGRGVLAVHAEVNVTAQGLHLRSFSPTGTRVNGAPVTEHYVSADEQPEIGDGTRISIQMAQAAAPPPRRSSRETPEGPPRRASRPAPPAAATGPAGPPANSFMATLWRYRIIAAVYGIVLIVVALLFVGDETSLAAQFQSTEVAFAQEAAAQGVPAEVVKARWAAVEKAYSLERAGRQGDAIEEYLRLMAAEMNRREPAGGVPTKSAAWKFAAQRLAELRSRR